MIHPIRDGYSGPSPTQHRTSRFAQSRGLVAAAAGGVDVEKEMGENVEEGEGEVEEEGKGRGRGGTGRDGMVSLST